MQLTKNISLQELVSKQTFDKWGPVSIQFIDQRIPPGAQLLRDILVDELEKKFGKLSFVINDWVYGGQFNESCYRIPNTKTGGLESQHKFGRAIDFRIYYKVDGVKKQIPSEMIRDIIKKRWPELKAVGWTTIEADTATWVHIDMRWRYEHEYKDGPIIVNP
jgi:hypothetical protein